MKSKIEYKRYLFTAAFICFFWLILSWPVLAAYQIEVGLPNLPAGSSVSDPGAYIRYFFIFGLGLVGFLAVGAIVVGGIMYMTGGTVGKVEKARQIIWGAVTGVVLLLCSYLLLYTIDPTLVNLSPFKPPAVNIPQRQQGQAPASCDPNLNQTWDPMSRTCITCPSGETYDYLARRCKTPAGWECQDTGIPTGPLYTSQSACESACLLPGNPLRQCVLK